MTQVLDTELKAEDIESLSDARIWAVEHDANDKAWWNQQWKDNAKLEIRVQYIENELRAVKSKIVWATGAVNVITGFLGAGLAIALAYWKLR